MKNEPKSYSLPKACEQNLSKLKDRTDRGIYFIMAGPQHTKPQGFDLS